MGEVLWSVLDKLDGGLLDLSIFLGAILFERHSERVREGQSPRKPEAFSI